MIDAVVTPPAKNRPARNKRRDIPPDLLEEILLRLPMKSLFRFSSASKSWNSMILGSCFVNRYRGRQMIVFKPEMDGHLRNASVCPLSSVSPKNPLRRAFRGETISRRLVRRSLVRSSQELFDSMEPFVPNIPETSGTMASAMVKASAVVGSLPVRIRVRFR